jgi:hypothetical protein
MTRWLHLQLYCIVRILQRVQLLAQLLMCCIYEVDMGFKRIGVAERDGRQ